MSLNCDRNICYFCGVTEPKNESKDKKFRRVVEVHHIIERNEGGDNSASNKVACCGNCHSKIHMNLIKIDKWYNLAYCFKLKWTDENGTEHFGSFT